MKVIDRYLLRGFLLASAVSLLGLLLLFVVFDFLENLDEFLEALRESGLSRGEFWRAVAVIYAGRGMTFLLEYGALAFLLGASFATVTLKRANELLAIQAAGASYPRAFASVFLAGCLVAGLELLAGEHLLPLLADASLSREKKLFGASGAKGRPSAELPFFSREEVALIQERPGGEKVEFFRGPASLLLQVQGLEGHQARELVGLVAPPGRPPFEFSAEGGEWKSSSAGRRAHWRFRRARLYLYGPRAAEEFSLLETTLSPEVLSASRFGAGVLSLAELWRLRDRPKVAPELHRRLASPFATPLLLLWGLACLLRFGTRSALSGLALALLSGAGLILCKFICGALAAESVSPLVVCAPYVALFIGGLLLFPRGEMSPGR